MFNNYQERVKSVEYDSLLGYFPLDDPSGACTDRSKSGINGTYSGSTLVAAKGPVDGRPVLSNDGVNDVTNLTTAAQTHFDKTEGSLIIWAKVSSVGVWTDGADDCAWDIDTTSSEYLYINKSTTANKLHYVWDSYSYLHTTSSIDWMCLGITWKTGGNINYYYNGTSVDSDTYVSLSGTVGLCVVGAWYVGGANAWSGNLAHYACWATELSATQMAYLAKRN